MSNRLPQIFTTTQTLLTSPGIKKKQGGIFQLHLDHKKSDLMNETFTAGLKDKNFRTSICKKSLRDTQRNYRTLTMRDSKYEIPRQKRLLTSHMSLYRSARVGSFSLQKNPQTCTSFHQTNEVQNVTGILANRNKQIVQLEFKMTPFMFVAKQYRKDLQLIQKKISHQINQMQNEFTQSLKQLRLQMISLRKQTGNQLKVNKIQLTKYEDEIKMYKQMAQIFPDKMNTLGKQI